MKWVVPPECRGQIVEVSYADGHKVLAPGHGFNSERSKQSENGGRP
jgi:hypothetical protein